jgi:hypothetical protein
MTRRAAWDGVRALRLLVFAVTATCLALLSHRLAGGASPAWAPTVLACALPGAAGAVLTRRRRGPLEILVVLAAVQVAMHVVFDCSASAMPSMSSAGGGSMSPGAGLLMPAAHTVAVGGTALLLARGEAALHAVLDVLAWLRRGARPMPGAPAPVPVVGRRAWSMTVAPAGLQPGLVAAADVVRRGPPSLV